jgi:hypothetical protein
LFRAAGSVDRKIKPTHTTITLFSAKKTHTIFVYMVLKSTFLTFVIKGLERK